MYGQQEQFFFNQQSDVAYQLRMINQDFVDGTIYFQLNGECHGQKVFEVDLHY